MTEFAAILHNHPEFALFLALVVGYLIGQDCKIKGLQLLRFSIETASGGLAWLAH